MRGVILAGGLGKRLRPLTLVTNKHLLPIYDRPMIYYPIQTLLNIDVRDIMIVTGSEYAGDFVRLLKNGKHLGIRHLTYAYQEGERGIADALLQAEEFAEGQKICVILGDNLIEGNLRRAASDFAAQPSGARFILKQVTDPRRFGVAEFNGQRITRVIEKPSHPPSKMAVTGFYFYHADVFEICRQLAPSPRGELEITDVNNVYVQRGDATHSVLDGWWADAGTIESLYRVTCLVAKGGANRPDLPPASSLDDSPHTPDRIPASH